MKLLKSTGWGVGGSTGWGVGGGLTGLGGDGTGGGGFGRLLSLLESLESLLLPELLLDLLSVSIRSDTCVGTAVSGGLVAGEVEAADDSCQSSS